MYVNSELVATDYLLKLGRFNNLPRNMRTCQIYKTDFEWWVECKAFDNLHTNYFKPVFRKNGSAVTFDKLMIF